MACRNGLNKGNGMYSRFLKRFLDVLLSFTALAVLSPLLVILTAVTAAAMKGNPFFTQMRAGMIDGKTGKIRVFRLVKFRTMSNETDPDGNLLPDADRLNAYGRFLRASSLDELPELWNILTGDMSFVGPRPWIDRYLTYFNEFERKRQLVRPGLTGLSQVSGRNAVTWKRRFELDAEYAENVSFGNDLKILLLTVRKVFSGEGVDFSEGSQTLMEYLTSRNDDSGK